MASASRAFGKTRHAFALVAERFPASLRGSAGGRADDGFSEPTSRTRRRGSRRSGQGRAQSDARA